MRTHTSPITPADEPAAPPLGEVEVGGMTRSSFLLRGALAAGSVYGLSAVAPFVSSAVAKGGGGDVEILNFALTLEYLEADFYNVKAREVGLGVRPAAYAKLFGEQETEHVEALFAAVKSLGGKPVTEPAFAFPVSDEGSFLRLASLLENTGVSAYNGAAPSLQSKAVLAEAAGIVQVEARHAAAINLLIGRSPTPTQGFDVPLTQAQVLAKAGPLIKT